MGLPDIQTPFHHVRKEHWNPGATLPLVLPMLLLCNTDEEDVWANIRANSRLDKTWLDFSPAHDGVAIVCGAGPSLADTLPDIRAAIAAGGKVFACNSAAQYLASQGIIPDYQVIVDSRPETKVVIGPAVQHLFASQVHPDLFALVPDALIWHLEVKGIDDCLPDYEPGYALIGGGATVGNTCLCLTYAMGYRHIEVFGLDSSNKGSDSHVIHQPLNDGEPMATIYWRGKVYVASLTMRLQAEKFQTTARALKQAGCIVKVHGYGLLPDVFNADPGGIAEVEKYRMMWSIDGYRNLSPGENSAGDFLQHIDTDLPIVDFGCGTGRGGATINKLHGNKIILVDFAENCLDDQVREGLGPEMTFIKADLTQPMTFLGNFGRCTGYCADVMEHIPPADVDTVLTNIMGAVEECFFRIDFNDDLCGIMIGESLHLSIHEHQWWLDTFMRLGFGVEWSRDEGGHGLFHVVRHAVESVPADDRHKDGEL